MVPERLKKAPNAKMFLRSFWYRAVLKEAVVPDEMHLYTLARCGGNRMNVAVACWQQLV
jgi:hypothetical protein